MFAARRLKTLFLLTALTCFITVSLCAQDILNKRISLSVNNQPLASVLKQISRQGNFYFSYNSTLIRRDSLVTLTVSAQTIQQVLDQLFGNRLEYRQNNNYIILRKKAASPNIITGQRSEESYYTVTGYVLNAQTGEQITNASIYEKKQLTTTLSNEEGFFSLKLKSRYRTASLTISKVSYEDTSLVIQPPFNQQLTLVLEPVNFNYSLVTIGPSDPEKPDPITGPAIDSIIHFPVLKEEPVTIVERTAVGRFLLSTKQKIQSLNLSGFVADRPFQFSVIPGVSTRGKLSGRVNNNFSLNLLGGYTGGVEGVELGGLFNINTRHVRFAQMAGLFNITGGPVEGVQMAGVHNTVLNPVKGLQAAGITNFVKGNFTGAQLSGIHNHVTNGFNGLQGAGITNFVKGRVKGWQLAGIHNHGTDSVTGVQAGGFSNYARKKVTGLQIAGFGNISGNEMAGAQLSGFFNYARKLKGFQVGIINIADTSEGYSFGLINIVFKGYHKLVFSTNEVLRLNAAFKTGNKKLYSILLVGGNKDEAEKIYSFGYGLGTEISLTKRFSLNPELSTQYLYLGDWDHSNFMSRVNCLFTVNFGKYFSIFAGPSFVAYYTNQPSAVEGYKFNIPSSTYNSFKLGDDHVRGWIGWQAGVSFF